MTPLPYTTGLNPDGTYDKTLFYLNDNERFDNVPDPSIIYEDGYFYLYVSNEPIRAWRTRDFADFEYMGHVFTPEPNAWAAKEYWGPDVFKHTDGKYYMYYCALMRTDTLPHRESIESYENRRIGVAVADNPLGPFRDWEGTRRMEKRNENGEIVRNEKGDIIWTDEKVTRHEPPFDFRRSPVAIKRAKDAGEDLIFSTLDPSELFYDDNGDMYLYFVKHPDRHQKGNWLWAVKMRDPVTPDFDTLTIVTQPCHVTPGGDPDPLESPDPHKVNEGPFVLHHTTVRPDGTKVKKYYLTYSIFGYHDQRYAVRVAVADHPLGPFRKLSAEERQPTLGINPNYDHKSGTGHHSLIETPNGEIFIVYHEHRDPKLFAWDSPRVMAVDRLRFVYDEKLGFDILHANGPTRSLQPIPVGAGKYRNIASEATVSVTNAASDTKLLTDGLVAFHPYDDDREFHTEKGGTTVTLEFPIERSVKAVMVYNSRDINRAFAKIDTLVFEGSAGEFYIENLKFPEGHVTADGTAMRPGAAAIAVFDEMKVKKITLTVSQKLHPETEGGLSISDIAVLGK